MIEIENSSFRTDVYDKYTFVIYTYHILVRIARICDSSQRFNTRNKHLTNRLLQQGFESGGVRSVKVVFVGRMKRVALKQHCVWCREDEESGPQAALCVV